MSDRPSPGSQMRDEGRVGLSRTQSGRRSSLRFLPLALGAAAGVLLVIFGAALLSRRADVTQPPTAAPIARQICDDLTAQRYSDLYRLLTPAQQTIGSSDQFVASQRQLDAQLGATRSCDYRVVAANSASATLSISLARGSSSAVAAQAQLAFVGGVWRISGYDSSLVLVPAALA